MEKCLIRLTMNVEIENGTEFYTLACTEVGVYDPDTNSVKLSVTI